MSSAVETTRHGPSPDSSSVDTPPANRSGWSRRLGLAVVLFVVGLGLAGLAMLLGLPGSFIGDEAQHSYYTVEPVTLNITLKEDGELKPVNSVDVKCEVQGQGAGLTIQWIVDESTHVNKGDLLVRLASDTFEDRVEQAELEYQNTLAALEAAKQSLEITRSENDSAIDKAQIDLTVAEYELERYVVGVRESTEKDHEIAIRKTTIQIELAQDELDKNRKLAERGFVTPTKIRELEEELERLKMTKDKQELDRETFLKYEFPKNKIQRESAVRQAREELEREKKRAASREATALAKVSDHEKSRDRRKDRLDRLREQLAKCEIRAPIDGVVQYGGSSGRWWRGNPIAPGEQVRPGQTILTIPDTSRMMVGTRIHEADRHMIQEGLRCLVRVPAVPGETFEGRLEKISQFADSERSWLNPDLKEHAAEILLEQTTAKISPGDTAHVEIFIEEVPDALAVPVQCVYSRGDRRFVFRREAGTAEPVVVDLGRSTTEMIEVRGGLAAGDQVLMHVDEGLLAKLPSPGTASPDVPTAGKPDADDADSARADSQTDDVPSG